MLDQPHIDQLSAIDIFAGGGGLTVGLKRAGFSVLAAVELDPFAYLTYKTNNPEVKVYLQDVRRVDGKDLISVLNKPKLDLLAGCPPCQGFCSLTTKYKRSDPRNELINEMSRLVGEIKPCAIMMENVPGLVSKGKPLFDRLLQQLKDWGYLVNWKVLEVADYGVPQRRKRLVLLAGHNFDIPIPNPTHSNDPSSGLLPWQTVRATIGHMSPPLTMSQAKAKGGANCVDWHVVSDLGEKNISRLKHAKPGRSWDDIPQDLRPDCHKTNYHGFNNVYGRMSWDEPSCTITGSCTTLSTGRFGHPQEDRTISVREAALLQSFPVDYIICADHMKHACKVIGNALPCLFAEKLASQCFKYIKENT